MKQAEGFVRAAAQRNARIAMSRALLATHIAVNTETPISEIFAPKSVREFGPWKK